MACPEGRSLKHWSSLPGHLLLFLTLLLAIGGSAGAEQFQVNTYTTSYQLFAAVATDADGGFIVVWHSEGSSSTDSSETSIQGRRFTSSGTPLGGEFQVNTYTSSKQSFASIAVAASGDFVVVWQSNGSSGTDTYGSSIQGQRFASSGAAQGNEFQINTSTPGDQVWPSVAVADTDDFIVVWSDKSPGAIRGQLFDSNGSPLSNELQISTSVSGLGLGGLSSVGVDASDRFVVVWDSWGSNHTDTSRWAILGQRLASDGTPLGAEFQVNTYTLSDQQHPSVAVADSGDFVVVWESEGSNGTDTSGSSVQGQRFASDGAALDSEFQVNAYTTGEQIYGSVDVETSGAFVVVWTNGVYPAFSVQGRSFSSAGEAVGGQFQVNSYLTQYQMNRPGHAVSLRPDGRFVATWSSMGSPGSDQDSFGIQARLVVVPELLFADGFESGDTTTWSAIVP